MKKFLLFTVLCMVMGGHFVASADVIKQAAPTNVQKQKLAEEKHHRERSHKDKKKCKHRCKKDTIAFGSKEINRKGGFVITKPGTYCLKEDVVFKPKMSTIAPVTPTPPYDPLAPTTVQAAITIRS
jgi:hypothetical protein